MVNGCKKGKSFERHIASELRVVFPKARRHLENHEEDAARGADLIFTGPYRFQLKKLKKYAPVTCIEELTVDRMLGEIPVLVTAGDFLEPMAVLPFEEFLKILKRLHPDGL